MLYSIYEGGIFHFMFYSMSEKGFFNPSHPNLPADAVKIKEQYYWQLLNGQSEGKIISSDEEGYPVLTK